MYAGDGNIYIMDAENLDGEFDAMFSTQKSFTILRELARFDLNNNY